MQFQSRSNILDAVRHVRAWRILPALSLAMMAWVVAAPAVAQTQVERTILFVGNSFTFAAPSEVWRYRPDLVQDLNNDGVGGVPALFKAFADQAGYTFRVSLETSSGQTLRFHYKERRQRIDRAWDHVVLQEHSLLDPERPGSNQQTETYAAKLARLFRKRNPDVDIHLVSTWSRPDLVFSKPSPWRGQPIYSMAQDLDRAVHDAAASAPVRARVAPVGLAFNRAVQDGVADGDPYDGIDPGRLNLWAADNYHGSKYGYYLDALTIFGSVTRYDPRRLGAGEMAARDLGITAEQAVALQGVAAHQLGFGDGPG